MRAYEAMCDGFRLDEGIWRDRAIELMLAMNSEILRLVEHERVIGNEEKTSVGMFGRIINAPIAPAINESDTLGYGRKRNLLVGVHRRTQSRKIDDDGIDCLRLEGDSISRCRPRRIGPLRGRRWRGQCAVHAQPSRQIEWPVLGRDNRLTADCSSPYG